MTDHSVFVGDLAPDVTDYILQEHFRQYFPSVRSAKVITDPVTGRSKGYGFVRFSVEGERDRALGEMNGQYISTRPIRVSQATAKKGVGMGSAPGAGTMGGGHMGGGHPSEYDTTNTTLFIGGLSSSVSEDQLRAIFGRFGGIVYVKIPPGKGCGFVQFMERGAAEVGMAEMNGQTIGNSAVRISWGRSNSKGGGAAAAALQQQQAAAAYGYGGGPYAAMGYGYDQAAYASYGAGGYMAADPYAMYAAYGADPAQYAAYQATYGLQPSPAGGLQSPSGGATGGGGVGGASAGAGGGASPLGAGVGAPAVYDPLGAVDVARMNAAVMQRQQSALTGGFLRQPS